MMMCLPFLFIVLVMEMRSSDVMIGDDVRSASTCSPSQRLKRATTISCLFGCSIYREMKVIGGNRQLKVVVKTRREERKSVSQRCLLQQPEREDQKRRERKRTPEAIPGTSGHVLHP